MRDIYSDLGFFEAYDSGVVAVAGAGETLDLRDYDAANIAALVKGLAASGAMGAGDAWKLVLQHGLASDAGVSAWSNVPASLMLHSTYGVNGADSTLETGVFETLGSGTQSGVFFVGYRGDGKHRYLRLYLSISGAPSAMNFGAVGVLGLKHQWPVNEPK